MKDSKRSILWRGICALAVAIFHYSFVMKTEIIQNAILSNSYLFVDFFFVLSGFVVCHAYRSRLDSPRKVGGFVLRRFGRLWPLHAVLPVRADADRHGHQSLWPPSRQSHHHRCHRQLFAARAGAQRRAAHRHGALWQCLEQPGLEHRRRALHLSPVRRRGGVRRQAPARRLAGPHAGREPGAARLRPRPDEFDCGFRLRALHWRLLRRCRHLSCP